MVTACRGGGDRQAGAARADHRDVLVALLLWDSGLVQRVDQVERSALLRVERHALLLTPSTKTRVGSVLGGRRPARAEQRQQRVRVRRDASGAHVAGSEHSNAINTAAISVVWG